MDRQALTSSRTRARSSTQAAGTRYLVNDAVLGSIWIANPDGSIEPGLVPRTFEPADAVPETYFCDSMPVVQVGGLPFLFTGSTIPGITAMAERDGVVSFSSSCAGAVYSIPRSSLSDGREPWQRAADIRRVSLNSPGVAQTVPPALLAISNQQHRTVILNDAIAEDVLEPPFLLTQMRLLH